LPLQELVVAVYKAVAVAVLIISSQHCSSLNGQIVSPVARRKERRKGVAAYVGHEPAWLRQRRCSLQGIGRRPPF